MTKGLPTTLRKMVTLCDQSASLSSSDSLQVKHPTPRLDPKMVNAEISRLEKMFNELDTNKDGVIDIEEFTQGLQKMGYYHITSEQIAVLIIS